MSLIETSLINKCENDINDSIENVGGSMSFDQHWLPNLDEVIEEQLIEKNQIPSQEGAVRYDQEQDLTDEQQETARGNIDAVGKSESPFVYDENGDGVILQGFDCVAEGSGSLAHGERTIASGYGAHAEGDYTIASGSYSHTEGLDTITSNDYEHAEGMWNVSNGGSDSQRNTLKSIGVGTQNTRRNAVEVMQNGDVYIKDIGGYNGTYVFQPDVPFMQLPHSLQVVHNYIDSKLSQINQSIPTVVASKRIPLNDWGWCPIRFSKRPTFVIKGEDVVEVDPNETYVKIRASILHYLLTNDMLTFEGVNFPACSILSVSATPGEDNNVTIETNSASDLMDIISVECKPLCLYAKYYNGPEKTVTNPNAIRRKINGDYELTHIDTAKCTSPNIIIQNGNIVGCRVADARLISSPYYPSTPPKIPEVKIQVNNPCLMKYKCSGRWKHKLTGRYKKIKWRWIHHPSEKGLSSPKKKQFKIADGNTYNQYSPIEVSGYFNRSNRSTIDVKVYSLCYKRRYVSKQCIELQDTLHNHVGN